MAEFEPKIIGFLCNWCSYAGADLAGVSRVQYPPNTRTIRVMCSGRIDPVLIVEAFMEGIDGIIVGGCHIGDCHYQTGNYYAEQRMTTLKKALANTGIGPDRVRLEWVSASEGTRFGEVITEFTEQIKAMGPNPILKDGKKDDNLLKELLAVKNMMADYRVRLLLGKQSELTERRNVYNEKIDIEKYDNIIKESIRSEYIRNYILVSTMTVPMSVKDISAKLNLNPREVLNEVVVLRRKNKLALERIDGTTPKYLSLVREVDS